MLYSTDPDLQVTFPMIEPRTTDLAHCQRESVSTNITIESTLPRTDRVLREQPRPETPVKGRTRFRERKQADWED